MPLYWAPVDDSMPVEELVTAVMNREIELKFAEDHRFYWRRDLCEDRHLGL